MSDETSVTSQPISNTADNEVVTKETDLDDKSAASNPSAPTAPTAPTNTISPAPSNKTAALTNQISKLKNANDKYKSLLKMAKERIQTQEDDMEKLKEQVSALNKRNEELSAIAAAAVSSSNSGKGDDPQHKSDICDQSDSLLIRVWQRVKVETSSPDVESGYEIWALLEFESDPDTTLTPTRTKQWKRFMSEQALSDYIRRDNNLMGDRITLPAYSLTPEQSLALEEDGKKNLGQITEEFRRYRVKAEVARRQADDQLKTLQSGNVVNTQKRIEGQDIEKELAQARSEHIQLETLKRELAEQESHWKSAYETILAENNALKSSGAEALLAAQWRQRYEACNREKDDLSTKLQMVTDKAKNTDMHKYEAKYRELKDAFRSYRRKAKEIFDDVQKDSAGAGNFSARVTEDAKIQYLRNLMVNYLSADPEIREHMEIAICTVLKFSDEEKARIEKKRLETDNWFSMIKI